ncbi:CLUMA_CG006709, isoform A [Clunio marinus]|uniref:CLUMA_CG006709, isoform A n=1 Tax=Clunio marinus TaxID=568069 RepID=A0A1J1I0B8_9DIPT|nr:CLUMA_CG006709, isoform A [Clunio marinus]
MELCICTMFLGSTDPKQIIVFDSILNYNSLILFCLTHILTKSSIRRYLIWLKDKFIEVTI